MHAIEVNKLALSSDDDKRIIQQDGISTKARGHCGSPFVYSLYYLSNWIDITNSELNQEATLCLQGLTSTLLIRKLSQVHVRGNTLHDYQGLERFLSICKFSLTTPYQLLCVFDHHVLHQVAIGTDTTHPQVIYLLQDSSLI